MKKTIQTGLLFVLSLFITATVSAQDFWMQKSYKRWTKDDITRLISDSPWAQVVGTTDTATSTSYVTVRLRSSILIRQALVRLKQIETGYDKLDIEEKKQFDEKMKGTMDCPACQENIVVTISPPITKTEVRSGVFGLVNVKFEELKGSVYLINDKGDRRDLVYFNAPPSNDGEATLFFPRFDDKGKPMLDGESKTVTLIFEPKGSRWTKNSIPKTVKFDAVRLMIDKKPEF